MAKRTLPLPLLLLLLATCTETLTNNRPTNPQSVAVLTQHNDNTRSGWNDKETALTTSNVNVQQFGAVFTLTVDDQVYAQPLVVGHVSVGGGDRNVVYIATVNNTLYAYDGDDGTRSEEHTSELQSRLHLVCRLRLGKKKTASKPAP